MEIKGYKFVEKLINDLNKKKYLELIEDNIDLDYKEKKKSLIDKRK